MSLGGQGGLKEGTPDLEGLKVSGETAEILAKKAGVSKTNMYYLLAVYRSRPDIEEKVFNGEYTINKAYTQMKSDEEPEQEEVERLSSFFFLLRFFSD